MARKIIKPSSRNSNFSRAFVVNGTPRRYSAYDVDNVIGYSIDYKARLISLVGEIDEEIGRRAMVGLALLNSMAESQITIVLSSPGGCTFNGWGMHDAITNSFAPVDIEAYGQTMSMAAVILQAGRGRLLSRNSTIMIHDGYNQDPERIPTRSYEAWGIWSKKDRQRMYKTFAERSGTPVSEWEKLCAHDAIFSSEQAVNLGLADRIIEPYRKLPHCKALKSRK